MYKLTIDPEKYIKHELMIQHSNMTNPYEEDNLTIWKV